MRNRETNSFFDESIMPILSNFNEEDRIRLCKFLFNAFSDTAAKYFRTYNLPESEVRQMVTKEHKNLESMLLEHLKAMTTKNKQPDEAVDVDESQLVEPEDDQFVNDALIEMNLLLKELEEGK